MSDTGSRLVIFFRPDQIGDHHSRYRQILRREKMLPERIVNLNRPLQPAFYLSSRTKQRDNCDPYEAPETRKNSGFIPQQISAVFQLFSVGPTALICKNSPADGIKIDAVPRKCISDRLLIFYKTPA